MKIKSFFLALRNKKFLLALRSKRFLTALVLSLTLIAIFVISIFLYKGVRNNIDHLECKQQSSICLHYERHCYRGAK